MQGPLLVFIFLLCDIYSAYDIDPIIYIRKKGFDQDHKTFSHEIVAPWSRPFKPGYCDSWEWHTDPRYKETRLRICRELSGSTLFNSYMTEVVII